jgi:hypothetical protein
VYGEKLICQMVPSDTVAMPARQVERATAEEVRRQVLGEDVMKPASSALPITQVPMRLRCG